VCLLCCSKQEGVLILIIILIIIILITITRTYELLPTAVEKRKRGKKKKQRKRGKKRKRGKEETFVAVGETQNLREHRIHFSIGIVY